MDAVAKTLLPPLPLYRRLLRVHRKLLPAEMRVMGDEYVKAEFRRTKTTDNPLYIVGFLSEWKKYLDHHEQQLVEYLAQEKGQVESEDDRIKRIGKKLPEGVLEQLSADQLGQLYELMQATRDIYMTPEEIAERDKAQGKSQQPGIPAGQVLPDLASAHPPKGDK
ncbi:hypothetical protein OIO90_003689 [Microbotryomycetes sp. JL221]|nr:hypothetical protein OIO90_003689 [Microbotryomycetes sp. JL221]